MCIYVENNYILSPGNLLLEAKHQTSMENMHVENNYILSTGNLLSEILRAPKKFLEF